MKPGEVPLSIRLSHEIPKPKDWQAFERGCLILFREDLRDPTMMSFGRSGQDQGGIDLLGRRDHRPEHFVGVQCRDVARHDKPDKILSDCRAAIALDLDLKELIFATTAPNDVKAAATAHNVERKLRAEGHNLKVVIYGWGNLQELIGRHDEAYRFFFPAVMASYADVAQSSPKIDPEQLAITLAKHLSVLSLTASTSEAEGRDLAQEDPTLHARIEVFRNIFKEDGQGVVAERRLKEMLDSGELEDKPKARFRVESVLGSIAIDAGREQEGALRFENAHGLRPGDPDAKARLALARTIQGRHAEAMGLAQEVLRDDAAKEHVVGFLLQAAARSGWHGDPEDLIPERFRGSPAADLGLAEFWRLRETPGWEMRSLDLAARHAEVPEFRRVRGLATLSFLVSSGAVVPGVRTPLDHETIQRGADDLKAVAEHCIAVGYAKGNDLVAHLANAGAMLRVAGRHRECEALLRHGVELIPQDPHVRRQLALAQSAQGRREDALRTLATDPDPENVLLRAELTSAEDPTAALAIAHGLDPTSLDPTLARVWARTVGDLACRVGDGATVTAAVERLRSLDPDDVNAGLIEFSWTIRSGGDAGKARDRLRRLAASLPDDASAVDRYVVAVRLREQNLPAEAAQVLEDRIDFAQGGPMVNLYLQCLSAARRDEAFRRASAAVDATTTDVDLHWTIAAHAWNIGDLAEAERATSSIRRIDPENEHARQLRVEILIRQNRTNELLKELEGPVEAMRSGGLRERSRIASLLAHFGNVERGAALAYRLFLENRSESQAWMTLAGIVLDTGRSAARPPSWSMTEVGEDAAVDLLFDDGDTGFCIVEPDLTLRHLDGDSIEPGHPLVAVLRGLSIDGRFTDPAGRSGKVAQIRHKFVARFHYVLAHHQSRFPEVNGFRRIDIEPGPDGFGEMVEKLKERAAWFDDERRSYQEGPWSLGMLAHRLGVDTIEAAGSVVAAGHILKVSDGGTEQRNAASRAVVRNGRRGCVMDLLCFWTAWDLKAIGIVEATCGAVHLPQSVVDRLRARRDELAASVKGGLRAASVVEGRLSLQEAPPERVQAWVDDVDGALRWIDERAAVEPVIVDDGLHPDLREFLRAGTGDMLDAMVVARRADLLLLTDDGPTRGLASSIGFETSAWLNQVFLMAFVAGRLDRDTWVRWSAALIGGGHSYMGASGAALATAAILDASDGMVPGPLLGRLLTCVGGKTAEPTSHVLTVVGALRELWLRQDAIGFREKVSSEVLRHLTRDRLDHPSLLRAVVIGVSDVPGLADHVRAWSRGHFLRIA